MKLLRGPVVILLLGIALASVSGSIDSFHGMDPAVLAFFGSVAAAYLLLNFLVRLLRRKA